MNIIITTTKFHSDKIKREYQNILGCLFKKLGINQSIPVPQFLEGESKGQYLIVDIDGGKHFIYFSAPSPLEGRNSYISQSIPGVWKRYRELKKSIPNLEFYVYLFDDKEIKETSDYILYIIRCLRTAGLVILNDNQIINNAKPFTSISDLKLAKQVISETNKGNNPTYIYQDVDGIIIFAKYDGANNGDAIIICSAIGELVCKDNRQSDEKISAKVIPYSEKADNKDKAPNSELNKYLLDFYEIPIEDTLRTYEKGDRYAGSSRNQNLFRFNLSKKYAHTSCFLCRCEISKLLVASHIHRVADIDKSPESFEEKIKHATSGENGIWLCSNHDKLFEHGLITFKLNGEVALHKLEDKDLPFFGEITTKYGIPDEYITKDMQYYLTKHHDRVKYKPV